MDKDRLLTVDEAAARLALKPGTLRSWILHRRIEFVRVGLRSVRIRECVVTELLERGRVPAAPAA